MSSTTHISSKQRFTNTWGNQTDIGRHHGISSIQLGKILTQQGLKNGKLATDRAITEGYAKATPLGDGTPFFHWHRKMVENLLISLGKTPLSSVDYHVARIEAEARAFIKAIERDDEEGGKLYKFGPMVLEESLEKVPTAIRTEVRRQIEAMKLPL